MTNGIKSCASNVAKSVYSNGAKSLSSNGEKSFNSNGASFISKGNGNTKGSINGNGLIKTHKTVHSEKEEHQKLAVQDSLAKSSSTLPKVDRVQTKFSLGKSSSKRMSATSELKPNLLKDQAAIANEGTRGTDNMEGHESSKAKALLRSPSNGNCSGKDKKVDVNNSASTQRHIASSDDKKTSMKSLSSQNLFPDGNHGKNSGVIVAKKSEFDGMENCVSNDPAHSRSKRKYNNDSIMLSKSLNFCGKLQEFQHQ